MSKELKAATEKAKVAIHPKKEQSWVRGSSLEMPPAKPAYDQRWIRFMQGNDYDMPNLSRKLREGWKPVGMDSVSEDWKNMHTTQGRVTGIIVEGMLLCERHKSQTHKRTRFVREMTARRTDALKHDLDTTNSSVPGSGFHQIQKVQQSTPMKEVQIQEDD